MVDWCKNCSEGDKSMKLGTMMHHGVLINFSTSAKADIALLSNRC